MRTIFIVFASLISIMESYAQCCSAGNPAGGDGLHDGLTKQEFSVFLYYDHSLSKDYFYHDSKTDVPIVQQSYYDFTNLSLTYGLSNKLTIHAELGYFIDKTQDVNLDNLDQKIPSHGLGDLALNLRYELFKTFVPKSQLVLSGGLKLPIGAFSEEMDGVVIPVSLQPSSGAFKYNASLYYNRMKRSNKFGYYGFFLYEYSSTIEKDFLIYQYGNYFQLTFSTYYNFTQDLNLTVKLKSEFRGHDQRENNTIIESTGSRVVYICPMIQYSFLNNWQLLANMELPIYKYVNGYQLTKKFSAQIGIRKSFSLKRKTN